MKDLRHSEYTNLIYTGWMQLYLCSVVFSMIGAAYDYLILHAVFKSLFMPLVSAFLWFRWRGPYNKPYYILQFAFLMAWIGDIAMIFQKMYPICFSIGATFFLVQHNMYIWINLLFQAKKGVIWSRPYWGMPNLAYVILLSFVYFLDIDKMLKTESMIYSLFIATSFLTSVSREISNIRKHFAVVFGFILFMASDLLIVTDKFLVEFPPGWGTSILLTYYAGQTLIAYGNIPDK